MTDAEREARVVNCKHRLLLNWCLPCLNAELDRVKAERDGLLAADMSGNGIFVAAAVKERDAAMARAEKADKRLEFHLSERTERLARESEYRELRFERDAAIARAEEAEQGRRAFQEKLRQAEAQLVAYEHMTCAIHRHPVCSDCTSAAARQRDAALAEVAYLTKNRDEWKRECEEAWASTAAMREALVAFDEEGDHSARLGAKLKEALAATGGTKG